MSLSGNLSQSIVKKEGIIEVKRVVYWDSRYYKITYERGEGKKKHLEESYFPSVTEILGAFPKDFLAKWRGDVGNDRADQIVREALQLGSFVHYGAEVLARGGAVIYNPVESPTYGAEEIEKLRKKYGENNFCICRFQKEFVMLHRIWQFFQMVKPRNCQTEQTVYSVQHRYAGTLDLFSEISEGEYMIGGSAPLYLEDGLWLADWKTGKGISHSNKMQLAAYIHAVLEGRPDLRGALRGGLLLHTNNEQVKAGIEGFKATKISTAEAEGELFPQFMKVYEVYKIDKPVPSPKEFSMPALLTYQEEKPARKRAR